ncbi:uncharacterized protein LOC117186557 [Drosophila miranda]|uniref:uncharacterized protein LOC117186557 n=1 Tax=Drosophila miranda TaxID=7229 RepID=UPI00143F0A90|nr:uncharacterized protein LOC117186557 [Drosophila miranda]
MFVCDIFAVRTETSTNYTPKVSTSICEFWEQQLTSGNKTRVAGAHRGSPFGFPLNVPYPPFSSLEAYCILLIMTPHRATALLRNLGHQPMRRPTLTITQQSATCGSVEEPQGTPTNDYDPGYSLTLLI